jgi:hypothetical protein
MIRRVIGIAAGAALLAGGVLTGMSLAGPDDIGEPRELAAPAVLEPVTGVPARGAERAARGKRGKGATIDFFYSRRPLVPPDNGSLVQPIRCPRKAGKPIGGGARTAQGITLAYLSRAHPQTAATPPRTYYVGVEDLRGAEGAGALIEVQCAKGMQVKN